MSTNLCPVCHSSHYVCSVADVINDGIHVTQTQGISAGMFGSNEFSQMYFTSTSQNRLSRILSPPRKPFGLYWYPIYILGAMAYFLVKYAVDKYNEDPSSGLLGAVFWSILGLYLSFLPGIGVGTAVYLFGLAMYTPARNRWKQNCQVLYSSRFCQQDGIVFDDEGNVYSPSDYVDVVFSK